MRKINISKDTQFAILGLSKFGRAMAATLYENGYNVLCCDIRENPVHEAAEYATHIVQADASDKAVLVKLGISNFDVVVIAFGEDFEAAAVTATILKELKVPYVVAKANGLRQKQIFESIGVDHVILPEREMGERFAYSLITNDFMESIHRSDRYDIIEMKPLPEWVGKTLASLRLRQAERLNVLIIIRNGKLLDEVAAQTVLLADDDLIALKSRL
jgi:trk system potassium uptake protein TrkA